jgi:hypothetical protein
MDDLTQRFLSAIGKLLVALLLGLGWLELDDIRVRNRETEPPSRIVTPCDTTEPAGVCGALVSQACGRTGPVTTKTVRWARKPAWPAVESCR